MLVGLLFLVGWQPARAQAPDTLRPVAPIRTIEIDNVDVLPAAIDTKGWLLLDKGIELELEGAVQNLYNFKYDKAEKQFRSLRRRYPQHPLPYFLMGLSTWWKIIPTQLGTKQYDNIFYAYMDTAIVKAEKLYKADEKNYEASFFLAAANGFSGRLHAERRDWRKAIVSSKRALDFLDKSKEANGLSPEFLFGQALFNYYSVWIPVNYPLLKPVLLFFPKGSKKLGLDQLRTVAATGFYTGTEASVFLLKILNNEENNSAEALPVARKLALQYPDNAYFQRMYALISFHQGEFVEAERVSKRILANLNQGMPGYEGVSGRYATYFLGFFMENKYRDLAKAKDYYQRCIVFSESTGDTKGGFYLFANTNLARIHAREKDTESARRYYSVVAEKADRKSEQAREAKAFLKTQVRSR